MTGKIGEEAAAQYIAELGYQIVARNWRCRNGELDLIALHDAQLVFIEVRTRRSSGRYGTAAESVVNRKRQRLRMLAQIYVTMHAVHHQAMRFDVITVMLGSDMAIKHIDHYANAF